LFKIAVKFGISGDSTVLKWEDIYYEQEESLMQENGRRKKIMSQDMPKK